MARYSNAISEKKSSKVYSIGFETMIGLLIEKENAEKEIEKAMV